MFQRDREIDRARPLFDRINPGSFLLKLLYISVPNRVVYLRDGVIDRTGFLTDKAAFVRSFSLRIIFKNVFDVFHGCR